MISTCIFFSIISHSGISFIIFGKSLLIYSCAPKFRIRRRYVMLKIGDTIIWTWRLSNRISYSMDNQISPPIYSPTGSARGTLPFGFLERYGLRTESTASLRHFNFKSLSDLFGICIICSTSSTAII